MYFTLVDILILLTTCLLLVFTAFLIITGKKSIQNRLLAALFGAQAYAFLIVLIGSSKVLSAIHYAHLYLSVFISNFAICPLIYLYTQSLVSRGFVLRRKGAIHFLPTLFLWLYAVGRVFYFLAFDGGADPAGYMRFVNGERMVLLNLAYLTMIVYAILSIRVLRAYRRRLEEVVSTVDRINLEWLRFVLFTYILVWALAIFNSLFFYFLKTPIPLVKYLNVVSLFVISIVVLFRGLLHPQLFSGIEENDKYQRSTLTDTAASQYLDRLSAYVESNQPHRILTLRIDELAKKLDMQPRHLSQILNEKCHQSFFEYINGLRVQDAKKMIQSRHEHNMTLLQIAYEVGFNSKASFNRAFIRHAGISPTQYVKKIKKNASQLMS